MEMEKETTALPALFADPFCSGDFFFVSFE